MKIHILGGPGSGKTTLARAIAARWQVPAFDLDQFGLKYGADRKRYVDESLAILRQPGWVTEGIYLLFVDLFLEDADHIVLLDVPWPTAASRMIRRHVTSSLRGTNQYPGLKLLYLLLKYARAYYRGQRPDAAAAMRAHLADDGARQTPTPASVLAKLEKYPSLMIPPTAAFVRQYLDPYHDKVIRVRNRGDQQRLLERLAQK